MKQSDRHRGQAYSCRDVVKRLYVVFRAKDTAKKILPSGRDLTSLVVTEARGGKKNGSPRRAGSQRFSKKKQNVDPQE
jgi:hypothetical protein